MKQLIRFILVPDAGAARRLRRDLAKDSARQGIVVGTWPELLEHGKDAYLVLRPSINWSEVFQSALERTSGAFWSDSLQVAPRETAAEVEAALSLLVSATSPGPTIAFPDLERVPDRPGRHIDDIVRLLEALSGALPEDLWLTRQLLLADAGASIRRVSVVHIDDYPTLNRWQTELVNKLNSDSGAAAVPDIESLLRSQLPVETSESPATCLQSLQQNLFTTPKEKLPLDSSVQWLGVRDYLEEVEVAAGMVQQILSEHPGLEMSEIGLLVPDDFEYALAVDDVFTVAGLTVSGLPLDHWKRDLGGEALLHFLYCRQKPAPAMAMASCLTSPLMPWTKEEGAALANQLMNGRWHLKLPDSVPSGNKAMLALLQKGDDSPETLAKALRKFGRLLNSDSRFEQHVRRAGALAEALCSALTAMDVVDWSALFQLAIPGRMSNGSGAAFTQQGVTIWRESRECWRPVRFLVVLGFASGHYPLLGKESSVLVADDLLAIRQSSGLPVATPADVMRDRRARFRRQLSHVGDFVCFMVPRRDAIGQPESPSESLVFMSQLYRDISGADSLILEMDSSMDRSRAQFLPPEQRVSVKPAREMYLKDLEFGRDLTLLAKPSSTDLPRESPSSLETLMVSPLAWLMKRVEADLQTWEPERLDVMLLGTLAHAVFEQIFQKDQALPSVTDIRERVDTALAGAIETYAPFMAAAQWDVERRNLMTGITRAAQAWHAVLTGLNAELLENEVWLQGSLFGVPIHGQADLLLLLPDGGLLVVDYKRSSSGPRRNSMERGYDSQANLYRAMLETGGPKKADNSPLNEKLRNRKGIGVVYYMINDQVALSDTRPMNSGAIPGWKYLEGDLTSQAMDLIRVRLRDLSEGKVCLNRQDDRAFFENTAKLTPYALDRSPLISLFTIHDTAGY